MSRSTVSRSAAMARRSAAEMRADLGQLLQGRVRRQAVLPEFQRRISALWTTRSA